MSYNYYRAVLTNDYLGISKEISAPTRYELERRLENQNRIWEEKAKREMARENKEHMKAKAEKMTAADSKKISEYENLIKTVCSKTSAQYYNSLIRRDKYPEFTTKLVIPSLENAYAEKHVPQKSFLEKVFKSKMRKRVALENEANQLYQQRLNQYNNSLNQEQVQYNINKQKFLDEQTYYNDLVNQRWEKYKQGDLEEFGEYLSYVLDSSAYPSDFIKDFELQYLSEQRILVVSYYLPTENLVPRTIQHKYVATRNEIDEIKLSDKAFEKFYNDIIYMCCLRTIKELFDSDDMNHIDCIVYNGWLKYIDKSTGQPAESCILTLEVDKGKFSQINLDNVDFKSCIRGLKGLFAPNILTVTPVTPYMNINRNDSRFIESKSVEEIAIDGYNLATMPWADFEQFIRELFDKMFNKDGGEVRVTQTSHDGGVDAIAFDADPIRGGKFVIQAKRYNIVVPVSAVRDLYGTMLHEGATKGILVTTSYYGKEAYDFAKDKPIKLIDGSELLGLLNQYGYKNLTIKLEN